MCLAVCVCAPPAPASIGNPFANIILSQPFVRISCCDSVPLTASRLRFRSLDWSAIFPSQSVRIILVGITDSDPASSNGHLKHINTDGLMLNHMHNCTSSILHVSPRICIMICVFVCITSMSQWCAHAKHPLFPCFRLLFWAVHFAFSILLFVSSAYATALLVDVVCCVAQAHCVHEWFSWVDICANAGFVASLTSIFWGTRFHCHISLEHF